MKLLSRVDSLWPQGLYSPWNSPGQNTGVGRHSLLRGSSQPRDRSRVSHFAGKFFTSWAPREAQGLRVSLIWWLALPLISLSHFELLYLAGFQTPLRSVHSPRHRVLGLLRGTGPALQSTHPIWREQTHMWIAHLRGTQVHLCADTTSGTEDQKVSDLKVSDHSRAHWTSLPSAPTPSPLPRPALLWAEWWVT